MVWQVEMAFFWQISDTEWERLFGQRENSADFAKTLSIPIIQPRYRFESTSQHFYFSRLSVPRYELE